MWITTEEWRISDTDYNYYPSTGYCGHGNESWNCDRGACDEGWDN